MTRIDPALSPRGRATGRRGDDAGLHAQCHGFATGACAEFGQNALDVVSHGDGADAERAGDFFGGLTSGELREYLALSGAQRLFGIRLVSPAFGRDTLGSGDRRAGCDGAEFLDEVLSSPVFRDYP